jgi:hypothetical protein
MCMHVLMEVCIFTEHVSCCVLPTVNTELGNWKCKSSGTWCFVAGQVVCDISKLHSALHLQVEMKALWSFETPGITSPALTFQKAWFFGSTAVRGPRILRPYSLWNTALRNPLFASILILVGMCEWLDSPGKEHFVSATCYSLFCKLVWIL